MNIEKLEVGMEIKNYKALCELICETPKGGDSKKSQLKELETLVDYEKKGYKFMIKEIYGERKEKIDGRINNGRPKETAAQIIEKLFLASLSEKQGVLFLTPLDLYVSFGLTNQKYKDGIIERWSLMSELEEFQITHETVARYYKINGDKMSRDLERALNNLQNRAMLKWHTKYAILRDGVITEATEEEERMLLVSERKALNKLKLKNINNVYAQNKGAEYWKLLKKYNKEKDIDGAYKGYKVNYIVTNNDLEEHKLTKLEMDDFILELNKLTVEKINKNTLARYNRAVNEITKTETMADVRALKRQTQIDGDSKVLYDMNGLTSILIELQ